MFHYYNHGCLSIVGKVIPQEDGLIRFEFTGVGPSIVTVAFIDSRIQDYCLESKFATFHQDKIFSDWIQLQGEFPDMYEFTTVEMTIDFSLFRSNQFFLNFYYGLDFEDLHEFCCDFQKTTRSKIYTKFNEQNKIISELHNDSVIFSETYYGFRKFYEENCDNFL